MRNIISFGYEKSQEIHSICLEIVCILFLDYFLLFSNCNVKPRHWRGFAVQRSKQLSKIF